LLLTYCGIFLYEVGLVMGNTNPIGGFLNCMLIRQPLEMVILFECVAMEEVSWPITPLVESGKNIQFDGVTEEEVKAAIQRLIEVGELRRVVDDRWRGFEVARYDDLQDCISEFGHRRYCRLAAARRREKLKEKVFLEVPA
jgi:hypothetical protein